MAVYYNETDKYCAQWLRNLIAAGLIPEGEVDDRSILDVRASDLDGFVQCHFFAGLGGWPYALRLAGWPDRRPVWTGSCPCQPFSTAGNRQGGSDERHLWPCWFHLIRERKPTVIFGEQVASAVGNRWLDAAAHDLEGEAYAFGAAVLPACAVDAPHRRDRLWFVADATGARLEVGIEGEQGQRASALGGSRPWPPESGIRRVAHGILARVAKLRALGNAIVPQVAAEFISAFLEARA